MCGLFGTFGPGIGGGDVRVFYEGLETIHLRGPHSTGVGFWDTHRPGLDWIKTAQASTNFLQNKEVRKKLESVKDPLVLMGHARFATRGEVTSKNAHPFQHGKTLLAQNGTLTGIAGMKDFNKYEVDSDAVTWYMNKHGLIPTLKALQGPFALTWMDGDKRTFNIVRNWGRDLFYTKHPHRAVWYYSSEAKHLEWILSRNENNVKRNWDIKEVKPHTLYQYRFDDRGTLHIVSLEKELFQNFPQPSLPRADNQDMVGTDTKRTDEDDEVISGEVLDRQFREALARDQKKYNEDYTPKVIDITARRKSTYGHFDGPKGPPEVYLRDDYGVKVGDWIRVKLIEFSPYSQSRDPNQGKAVGEFESIEAPDVYINAHSIDLSKWKGGVFTPGYYACKVSAVSWVDQYESYAIHVNTYKPIEEMPEVKEPTYLKKIVTPPAFAGILNRKEGILNLGHRTFKPEADKYSVLAKCPVGMTVGEFTRLTPNGCLLCHGNLHHHKKHKVYFIMKVHPLCEDCYEEYKKGNTPMDDVTIANRVIQIAANRLEEEELKKKRGEAAAKRLLTPSEMN